MPTIQKNIMKFTPTEELFGYKPDSQFLVWMKPSEFLVWMKPSEFLDQASKIIHSQENC